MSEEIKATISISEDANNKGNEQFKFYQKDGETVQVAIGKIVEVPLWVAKRALEIGDITDYQIIK